MRLQRSFNSLIVQSLMACCATASLGGELHRPVAMERLDDGRICVLNQSAGTISLIDPMSLQVTEHAISPQPYLLHRQRMTDVDVVDSNHVVVLDAKAHELALIQIGDQQLEVVGRTAVPDSPINVIVGGSRAFVASLWSRRWSIVNLKDITKPTLIQTVDLEFSPRHQMVLDDETVFVLDAFGGHWALIDSKTGRLVHTGAFSGSHNMTGVAHDAEREHLLIPHMTLNAEKPTTKFNVHWGDVVLNVIRRIPVKELENGTQLNDDFYYLGRPDTAAGDPTGVIVTCDNRQIVCFSGTSEVGISDPGANSFTRVKVGCRPIAAVLSRDEEILFVANQLDDTVSVINVASQKTIDTIRLTASKDTAWTSVQRGERLFYDSTLSSDGWFSCHSCHTDGHTNGGLADTFSDGSIGAPKRVPTLLGVRDTAPWSWTGSVGRLSDQIRKSVVTTMRGRTITDDQVLSLTEYVGTLEPIPAVAAARGTVDADRMERGHAIFKDIGCADCHAGDCYTSADSYEVGMTDESGNDRFNPPSLRAVSQHKRLFHDNRASSVRDVIEHHGHQNDGTLSDRELRDLVYFVEGL